MYTITAEFNGHSSNGCRSSIIRTEDIDQSIT